MNEKKVKRPIRSLSFITSKAMTPNKNQERKLMSKKNTDTPNAGDQGVNRPDCKRCEWRSKWDHEYEADLDAERKRELPTNC